MRKFSVAVCIDDMGGVMFNKRRQSRDRELIRDMCETVTGKIYITKYSEPLFSDCTERVKVCDEPLQVCEHGGTCFIEGDAVLPYIEFIDTVILYRWNRAYPSDTKLDILPALEKRLPVSQTEFAGSSHEKITKEVYKI